MRDTEHARAVGGALRMVWASAAWMAVEMLATWCVRKLREDRCGPPSPYRELSVAPGRYVKKAVVVDSFSYSLQLHVSYGVMYR